MHAHTSDAGLESSSHRISGVAYTAGVCSSRLIPGLYIKDSLKLHMSMFTREGQTTEELGQELRQCMQGHEGTGDNG